MPVAGDDALDGGCVARQQRVQAEIGALVPHDRAERIVYEDDSRAETRRASVLKIDSVSSAFPSGPR